MKEKEWKKEQKIPLLPVEFPEDSVMQKECRAIVEKAIPKRQSLWERSKEIYWGSGIRAIFYQSGSIWLIVACLYLGIGWLGQSYAKAARNADDNRVFRISGLFSGVCGAGMVAGCAEPHAGADRLASLFPELSVGTSHAVCRRDHDTGQCDRSSFIYGCFGKSICEYGSGGKQQCVFCLLRSVYMPATKARVVCFMQV